jgi:1,4-dihydroxy-2-naphthoate octaprenyltransferase
MVPVLLGTLLAPWLVKGIDLDFGLLLFALLGVSLAHLSANTANDFFDWKSGVDNLNADYVVPYSGGSRMIQLGVITPQGMLRTSLFLFVTAAIAGTYIATVAEIWPQVAVLAVLGAAFGILYTAPPVKLAARGLGEIVIALAFGPMLVAGATLVQTGTIELRALLAGIPIGLLTSAIIWVNEFPDVRGDASGGKRTLVVRLGLDRAKWGYVLLLILSYTFLIGFVLMEALPKQALVGLISLPLAFYVTRQLFRNYRSRSIKRVMAGTIYLHLAAGLLTVLGAWAAT